MSADYSGLSLVEKYYQDYGGRAQELKGQGSKIIGYLCAFVPLEIIVAAGLIPFRIKGSINEPINKADIRNRIDAFINTLETTKSKAR